MFGDIRDYRGESTRFGREGKYLRINTHIREKGLKGNGFSGRGYFCEYFEVGSLDYME